ncbi:MAG: TonB-dependent receptor plug domain-containing protein [Fibrobacterota bacterium]|nr:TonB-dependent receptor plug domain-containing protein [Fibrobacterota bacterium]QQS07010.1 MAG: TonB-dependent receptor plug domain-containing protein [Fibrobacterota bacterium]
MRRIALFLLFAIAGSIGAQSAPDAKLVPVVVRSSAPVGSQVTLDGFPATMDSAGKFLASVQTDSLRRATGSFELCLLTSTQRLCTPIRPQGFDTLDIAPLEVKIDSVVETRDTIRTIVDTTHFDSTALQAPSSAKVVRSSAGNTVTVRGKRRPPRVLGQERVTVQTIKRLPGLAEPDVIRAVQALPGVVQSSDFSTKLYVRGSSSDQNLILFDNAPVYSPAHFGGLFSTFLADATGGLDFYKGGFDPKYGNRLSSVLLVSSKVGASDFDSTLDSTRTLRRWADKGLRATEGFVTRTDSDSLPKAKMQGSLRLTTLSGSLATDGRQGEASWALAGRRTWIGSALEAARDLDLTTFALDYDFWDWQGSAAWGRDGDTVRVSAYDGRDKLDLGPFKLDWGNRAIPVNVRKRLGSDWLLTGTGAYSRYDQVFSFTDIFEMKNEIETWTGRGELQYSPNPFHRITAGYEYNRFGVLFTQDIPVAMVTNTSDLESDLHSAWLQERWTMDSTKTLSVGLRAYNDMDLVHDIYLDPRASFSWRFAPDWKADLHWGHYTQYMTSIRFADMEIPTEFWYAAKNPMTPTTQNLASLGFERQNLTPMGLRVGLEGYYKDIHGVPLMVTSTTQQDDKAKDATGNDYFAERFVGLDGWAAGAEASVAKEDGWWTVTASYAVGWSALQRPDLVNELQTVKFDPYWADWDQRHTFKSTVGLNWVGRGKNEALAGSRKQVPLAAKILTSLFPPMIAFWTVDKADFFRSSVQVAANSGLPMTDYQGYDRTHEPGQGVDGGQVAGGWPTPGIDNNTEVIANPRNADRRPGYFRLDVTPFDFGRTGKWRFYYTIINVTDRENVYAINYNTKDTPPKREETYQFPILPFFFGYEYQF